MKTDYSKVTITPDLCNSVCRCSQQTTQTNNLMKTSFNHKIERLICPFDFTRVGRAGLEYAGLLASALGARLTIFYVPPVTWTDIVQLYEDQNDSTRGIKRLLQFEAEAIEDLFGVETEYAFEPPTDSITMTVGAMSV